MATSDRIRAPLRANISRMPAEADSVGSTTPEFLIRRNLILRKRSTSDSEERAPSFGLQSSAAVVNEAFKADGPRSKGVHPGQQQVSPRVSRDVPVSPASHPAPPWNGQLRTSSAKTHDVGGGRGSVGTLGLFSKGGNMGEESSCDHVRADAPNPCELIKSGETDPQEFRYGPGFVDKLKSRFISLSLQEKAQQQSKNLAGVEGTMRRYSSLENVLEQDDFLDGTTRKRPIASTYPSSRMPNLFVPTRNSFGHSFKRAKSMETLLLESEHNMRYRNLSNNAFTNNNNNLSNKLQRPLSACDPLSGSALINENLVIIETVAPKGVDLTAKISKKTTARQVSVSSINDEELPKPDIVKTCKLIFETASKRPVAHSSVRRAPVLRQSAKSPKGPYTQQTNNQLLSKIVKPANIAPPQQPNSNLVSIAQQKFSAKENECVVNGDVSPPPVSKDNAATLHEKGVKAIPIDALGRIRAQGTTMTFNGSQKGKASASQAHTPKSFSTTVKPSSPPPPPPFPVVKATEKPVVSKELAEVETKQQQVTQNVEPVRPVSPTSPTPTSLSPAAGSESEQAMKSLPNGVVDASEDSKLDSPSEDLLLEGGDLEEPEILKPTVLLGRNKPGGLWQKTAPSANTVVYDFRGKEVKSHLPTNPTPYGCKPAKKVKKQQSNKSVLVNGTVGLVDPATTLVLGDFGESRDYDDDDEEYDSDELDIGAHLPALSGITFQGENVKCTKSSLLITRNKKLKIRFVESPLTHEYPAEESEISRLPHEDFQNLRSSQPLTNGTSGPPNGALPPPPPDDDDDPPTPAHAPALASLRQNMAIPSSGSSGGFSNYTPIMLSSNSDTPQLGVERLVPEEPHHGDSKDSSNSTSGTTQNPSTLEPSSNGSTLLSSSELQGEDQMEVLKPADPADMSSWSSSTSTSDLLF